MSTSTKIAPLARTCGCGCNAQVRSAKSLYVPGHDARHVSKVVRGESTLDTLPSTALRVKANDAIARLEAKASKPSKAVKAAASREGIVRVGRWDYPARQGNLSGAVTRNDKRDGSGKWIAADERVASTFRKV